MKAKPGFSGSNATEGAKGAVRPSEYQPRTELADLVIFVLNGKAANEKFSILHSIVEPHLQGPLYLFFLVPVHVRH